MTFRTEIFGEVKTRIETAMKSRKEEALFSLYDALICMLTWMISIFLEYFHAFY